MYETCPYSFYLYKIEGIRGDTNAHAEIGTYGHELNEAIFKKRLTPQEALDECIEEFDLHISEYMSDASKEKKYEALCEYLADFDEDFFDKYDVIDVEHKFRWRIHVYNCIGIADLILRRKSDGKILLVDHKSAGHFLKKNGDPLKNQEENFQTYKKQMYMYADAMKKEYGFYPDIIVWNHFLDKGQKTEIEFNENDLLETLNWVVSTIEDIYNDTTFEAKEFDRAVENNNGYSAMCHMLCNYRNMCEYKEVEDDEI